MCICHMFIKVLTHLLTYLPSAASVPAETFYSISSLGTCKKRCTSSTESVPAETLYLSTASMPAETYIISSLGTSWNILRHQQPQYLLKPSTLSAASVSVETIYTVSSLNACWNLLLHQRPQCRLKPSTLSAASVRKCLLKSSTPSAASVPAEKFYCPYCQQP